MKTWSDWETTRRQVAVSGRVVDVDGRPVAGARVAITRMPAQLAHRLIGAAGQAASHRSEADGRLDRTRTEADGCYWFLDLLPGTYTLQAADLRTGHTDERRVEIHTDEQQTIKRATVDFKLSMLE